MRTQILAFVLEIIILWPAVVLWTKIEGKRKGRSWRTQLTGILTILLHPFRTTRSHPFQPVSFGLIVWTITLLSQSWDLLAYISLAASAVVDQNTLYLIPAFCLFLMGKSVWLGGSQGIQRFATTIISVVLAITTILCVRSFVSGYELLSLSSIRGMIPDLKYAFRTNAFWRYIQRPAIIGVVLSQIPTWFIVIYTSISTQRSNPTINPKEQSIPINSLIPIGLLASALPIYIILPSSNGLSSVLIPLILMMGIRPEEGDVSWEVGILAGNIMTIISTEEDSSKAAKLIQLGWTIGWNTSIGYSPIRTKSNPLRVAGYVVSLLMIISTMTTLIPSHLIPASLVIAFHAVQHYTTSASLGITWLWSLTKLIQGVWAIGGFSRDRMDVGGAQGVGKPEIKVENMR